MRAHQEEAARKGVKIVTCCGFDSIPSDLGAQMMVNHIKDKLGRCLGSHHCPCVPVVLLLVAGPAVLLGKRPGTANPQQNPESPPGQLLCRPIKSVTALAKVTGGFSGGTIGSLLQLLEEPADEVQALHTPKWTGPSSPTDACQGPTCTALAQLTALAAVELSFPPGLYLMTRTDPS